jgi:hypothetical protein
MSWIELEVRRGERAGLSVVPAAQTSRACAVLFCGCQRQRVAALAYGLQAHDLLLIHLQISPGSECGQVVKLSVR